MKDSYNYNIKMDEKTWYEVARSIGIYGLKGAIKLCVEQEEYDQAFLAIKELKLRLARQSL